METVVGVFRSRPKAEHAITRLLSIGVADGNIRLLQPGAPEPEVPVSETEQPGMGKAMGGVVGAALGAAVGIPAGFAIASALLPGVGPVVAIGLAGAAALGAGGAAGGAAAGEALENSMTAGLPEDELFFYEDALRQGRSVLIASAEDEQQAGAVRHALELAGAESIDAARESWWTGIRDAGQETYEAGEEPAFRHGFEAAVHPRARGKSYDDSVEWMRQKYADAADPAFRRGYERGQDWYRSKVS